MQKLRLDVAPSRSKQQAVWFKGLPFNRVFVGNVPIVAGSVGRLTWPRRLTEAMALAESLPANSLINLSGRRAFSTELIKKWNTLHALSIRMVICGLLSGRHMAN
jgi:hypothetical protein